MARASELPDIAGDHDFTLAFSTSRQFLNEEQGSDIRGNHLQSALPQVLLQLGNHPDR